MDDPEVSTGAPGLISDMKNCWLVDVIGSQLDSSWIVSPEMPTQLKSGFCVGCIQKTMSPTELDPVQRGKINDTSLKAVVKDLMQLTVCFTQSFTGVQIMPMWSVEKQSEIVT